MPVGAPKANRSQKNPFLPHQPYCSSWPSATNPFEIFSKSDQKALSLRDRRPWGLNHSPVPTKKVSHPRTRQSVRRKPFAPRHPTATDIQQGVRIWRNANSPEIKTYFLYPSVQKRSAHVRCRFDQTGLKVMRVITNGGTFPDVRITEIQVCCRWVQLSCRCRLPQQAPARPHQHAGVHA